MHWLLLISLLLLGVATSVEAKTVRVRPYTKRNGQLVPPHHRSSPNRSKADNWSSRGNSNPYTGKRGSKDPFRLR